MPSEVPTKETETGIQANSESLAWAGGRMDRGQSRAMAQGLPGAADQGQLQGCNYLPPVGPHTKEPQQPQNSN